MNRSDFLKQVIHTTASYAYRLTEDLFEPLQQVKEISRQEIYHPLIPIDQYDGKPKLITSVQPPLYIVGEPSKSLAALKAICEADGFLLSYIPQGGALYCGVCNANHALAYEGERIVSDLETYAITVKEGYIYLVK